MILAHLFPANPSNLIYQFEIILITSCALVSNKVIAVVRKAQQKKHFTTKPIFLQTHKQIVIKYKNTEQLLLLSGMAFLQFLNYEKSDSVYLLFKCSSVKLITNF